MTTYASCWKITRQDATVEGYTDHDTDLMFGGVTYLSSAGYAPSAIERNSTLSPNNQEVVGIIDNVNLSSADLLAGVYDGARLEIIRVDWTNTADTLTILVALLGHVVVKGERYSVELQSIESELAKPIGQVVTLRCTADLGDSRCGYSLTPVSGEVDSVTVTNRVFIDGSRTEADGYFNGGKLTFTSGLNYGRTMDVKRYVSASDTIELFEPMPDTVAPGDTFNIYQGCDKTAETCIATFDNIVNFRGLPYIPGVSNLVGNNL